MKYTSEVFTRLSRGQFISSNSIDQDTRSIYNDIEENLTEYEEYFKQIDFVLCSGDGFFYFSRKENKVVTENKLQSLFVWIDYLDFLKSYDTSFSAGTQFKLSHLEMAVSTSLELKDKIKRLFEDKGSNREKLESLVGAMVDLGFAECINDVEDEYQVTSAFHYIEQIIMCINIDEEVKDEIPE